MDEFVIDREELLSTFLAEAEELLARLEHTLVALEVAPGDDELLNALFRDAHTLKGGAAMVAFDVVRDLAHDVEHVLERLRRRQLVVTNALVTLLLGSVDVLRAAVGDAAGGRAGSSEATAEFRRRLAEAASAAASGASAPAAPSTQVAAAPTGDAVPVARPSRTLRVDVARLDQMLDLSGEIGIARGRLGEMLERGGGLSTEDLVAAHRDADRLYLGLQELIMKARMVPIGPIFYAHVRTVRDLAAAQGKQARLVVEGADVEVDTSVVEQVRDPILHMVRNALDHGVETPAERAAAGKPPVATLTLRAFHDSGSMVLQVVDDGAGLDRGAVGRKAARLGLIEDPARATDEELMQAIFAPGFSTTEVVSEISGRGVGLDVVRRNVEALRGSVSVASGRGGTTFTVRIPLTLAIIQGFRVEVADQTYILPLDSVVECLELPREERGAEPTGVVNLRGQPLPFLRLRAHFGQPGGDGVRENVVVMRHGAATAGLVVDALQGESSTVIKPLGPMFKDVPGVAGSSILGDGRVALILDVGGLLRETLRRAAGRAMPRKAGGVEP
jgi:two-component system chemotaxis sensor kinase CheA